MTVQVRLRLIHKQMLHVNDVWVRRNYMHPIKQLIFLRTLGVAKNVCCQVMQKQEQRLLYTSYSRKFELFFIMLIKYFYEKAVLENEKYYNSIKV